MITYEDDVVVVVVRRSRGSSGLPTRIRVGDPSAAIATQVDGVGYL